jgi:hypothetical protein
LREHASVGPNPALCHRGIFGVQLDQDGAAAETVSDQASGASAAEWVEHCAAFRASGLDAWLD